MSVPLKRYMAKLDKTSVGLDARFIPLFYDKLYILEDELVSKIYSWRRKYED